MAETGEGAREKRAGRSAGLHTGHRANMRRRYIANGLNGFQDHETLELLLYYAVPRVNTNDIAHRLIESCGSLQAVLHSSAAELTAVSRVSDWAALLLNLISWLSVLGMAPQERVRLRIGVDVGNGGQRVDTYLRKLLAGRKTVTMAQICLSGDCRVQAVFFQEEDPAAAGWDIRKILLAALHTRAAYVILGRNTPTGRYTVRDADRAYAMQIQQALQYIQVTLVEYCVVTEQTACFLLESRFLEI